MRGKKGVSLNSRGTTLIEILMSAAIVLLLAAAASITVLNCQYFASYSRHKTQAMFAAQQIIEQIRRVSFTPANSSTVTTVQLDNYGGTVGAGGYFYGTATTTVTNIDAYCNHVDIEIKWKEKMVSGKKDMKEYYSLNIANDPITN